MSDKKNTLSKILIITIKVIIPILILLVGIAVGDYLMKTRPVAQRRQAERPATRVNVIEAEKTCNKMIINAMGTVLPAVEVDISAQVGGRIVSVSENFVPGGRFNKGDVILNIDDTDYKLLVEQRKNELQKAESKLRLEFGQQSIAMREYELLGEEIAPEDEEFVLRKPQLMEAQAEFDRLKSLLSQAEIDLERTTIKAPFNAIVKERYVNLGASINSGSRLLALYGTDQYWVELSLPVDELRWFIIPEQIGQNGSPVKVYIPGSINSTYKNGEIYRLRSTLESQGRMARVLALVDNPLERKTANGIEPPLLSGSFVRVEIAGIDLDKSIKLPRIALRDNDIVWVYNNSELRKIKTKPVHKDRNYFYLKDDLADGDLVVVSDISAPIEGMPLMIDGGGN